MNTKSVCLAKNEKRTRVFRIVSIKPEATKSWEKWMQSVLHWQRQIKRIQQLMRPLAHRHSGHHTQWLQQEDEEKTMVDWQNWPLCLPFSLSEPLSTRDSTLPARICSVLHKIKRLSSHFNSSALGTIESVWRRKIENERWATGGKPLLLQTIRSFKEL